MNLPIRSEHNPGMSPAAAGRAHGPRQRFSRARVRPVGVWRNFIDWKVYRRCDRIPNVIERDYQLKRAMGFSAGSVHEGERTSAKTEGVAVFQGRANSLRTREAPQCADPQIWSPCRRAERLPHSLRSFDYPPAEPSPPGSVMLHGSRQFP